MISSSLQDRIIARINNEGPISFAEYMRMALYEPGYGYYVTGPARMGWEGDYYTSTDVSDFFAHCLGRQLYEMWDQLGKPASFPVLEQGAGRGNLARDVIAWAAAKAEDLHQALDYRVADINSGLDVLSAITDLQHTPALATSDTPEDFNPVVILSNELVDAFPVHILQKEQDKLYEVYVNTTDGKFVEVLDTPGSEEIATYLDTYKVPWRSYADGWRAEINIAALRWIEQTCHLLFGPHPHKKRHGFLLTIDYGDTARKLYTPDLPQGTLTTYYQHQVTDRPLFKPGTQDITAHVNFTALIQHGRQQGLHLATLTSQREWLEGMGIFRELDEIRQKDFAIIDHDRGSDQGQIAFFQWQNLRQRVSTLTDSHGMGAFKVLIMKR